MVDSSNAVCFGLGPEGNDHLIINRVSGEVNRMPGAGINYLMKMWVIPKHELDKINGEAAS